MPTDLPVEFIAIDEIQLANDIERGHVFTKRIFEARGSIETVFLGSETIEMILKKINYTMTFGIKHQMLFLILMVLLL